MSAFRKFGLFGTAICGICVAKTALVKMATANASEGESSDRFDDLRNRGLELKMVQVFFRHGARTPLKGIPNPNNLPELETVWDKETLFAGGEHLMVDYQVKSLDGGQQPVMTIENRYRKTVFKGGTFAGQMTTLGKSQMYDLGKIYKTHYIDNLKFLEPTFTTEHIYVRSTNIMRTIESASCVLAGMFGETMKKHGPVTIYTDGPETEYLYPNAGFCKKYKAFSSAFWHNSDQVPGVARFRRQLQDILGMPDSMYLDLVRMRDNLAAMEAHKLPIPRYLEPLMDIIDRRATEIIKYYVTKSESEKKEVLQVTCGQVLQMIRENIQSVDKGSYQKFHIYSCHDTTLVSMLCGLKIFDNRWPPYAADLIFEVYQDKDGRCFVRTLYIGKEQRIMNNPETIVPAERFLELTSEVAVTEERYNEICEGTGEHVATSAL
ncbi:lysophosphatidic acid phosphatase type 6-like [Ptychodera flava]|uniref:lysophosphatidic acid phosphatase type 6-like n=1 Tax=Ptychodera flava TaxID=63121 RepID=UPI003969EB60